MSAPLVLRRKQFTPSKQERRIAGALLIALHHEFLMRKGALDFQQIEMAPVHARMREFYRNQR